MNCKKCNIEMEEVDGILFSSEFEILSLNKVKGVLYYACPICGDNAKKFLKCTYIVYQYSDEEE